MTEDSSAKAVDRILIAALTAEANGFPATALALREDALALALLIAAAVAVVDAPRDNPTPGQLAALRGRLAGVGATFAPVGVPTTHPDRR